MQIFPGVGGAEGLAQLVVHCPPVFAFSTDDRDLLGRVLGYGGFGVTYIGWDERLQQRVAIKEYLPNEFSTRVPGHSQVTVFDGEKKEPGRAARIFLLLGLFSMDIYILHEPVMTVVKLIFWNRLGLNYILCTLLIFFSALCLPIPLSRWIIRKRN